MQHKFPKFILVSLVIGLFCTLFLNTGDMPLLNPSGVIGVKERDLMVVSILLMLIVVVPTIAMVFIIGWKYRADNKDADYDPNWDKSHVAEVIWWGIPCAIVIILSVMIWFSTHELNPFTPLDSKVKPVRVQVVSLDWKWLFIYPEYGIASVNYMEVPEKTPINFEITSDAPMNSFWIPKLGGQIYSMPGMRTKLHLIADHPGSYRGSSANLSGKGFSGMKFIAKAGTEADFEQWVQTVKQTGSPLDLETYKRLSEPSMNNPVALYTLQKEDLFEWVIMKYMMPMEK